MSVFARFLNSSNRYRNSVDDDRCSPLSKTWHGRNVNSKSRTFSNESKQRDFNDVSDIRWNSAIRKDNGDTGCERRDDQVQQVSLSRKKYSSRADVTDNRKQQQNKTSDEVGIQNRKSDIHRRHRQVTEANDKHAAKSAMVSSNRNNNKNEEITMTSSSDMTPSVTTKRPSMETVSDKALDVDFSKIQLSADTNVGSAELPVHFISPLAQIPSEILLSFDDGRDVYDGHEEYNDQSDRDDNEYILSRADQPMECDALDTIDERLNDNSVTVALDQIINERQTDCCTRWLDVQVDLDEGVDMDLSERKEGFSTRRLTFPVDLDMSLTSSIDDLHRRNITGPVDLDVTLSSTTSKSTVASLKTGKDLLGTDAKPLNVDSNAILMSAIEETCHQSDLIQLVVKDKLQDILKHQARRLKDQLPLIVERKEQTSFRESGDDEYDMIDNEDSNNCAVDDNHSTCSSTVSSFHSSELNPIDVKFDEIMLKKKERATLLRQKQEAEEAAQFSMERIIL